MKGIKFNNTHSYYDLNLIMSDVYISPAKPKENYIDISGADGSLDLTEAHGKVNFKNRTGQINFSVLPNEDFETKKSEIANFLNGVYFDKITLDKDPDYYYQGRCSINEWKSDKNIGRITVDMVLKPWKLKQKETIMSFRNTFDGTLKNDAMQVIPTFYVSTDATIIFNDVEYKLTAGTHKILDICFKKGENLVKVITTFGAGTITYQEGSL